MVDEGKTYYKAITKYKRAFFSELDNEVSLKTLLNILGILGGQGLAEKVEIVRANEAYQEKLCRNCILS